MSLRSSNTCYNDCNALTKKSSTTLLFGEREGEIDGACVGLFDAVYFEKRILLEMCLCLVQMKNGTMQNALTRHGWEKGAVDSLRLRVKLRVVVVREGMPKETISSGGMDSRVKRRTAEESKNCKSDANVVLR